MQDAFNKVKPNDGFLVTKANYLTDFDRKVLTYLYQPLMGASAYSLLMFLWTEVIDQPIFSDRKPHSYIFTTLGEDLPTFYEDRIRLEGLGLMRTYYNTDKIGNYFVFELYAPQVPDKFFKEELLSIFLYDTVGETRFNELSDKFKLYPVKKTQLKEVTQDFLSVFHLNPSALEKLPAPIQAVQQDHPRPRKLVPKVTTSQLNSFDWEFLAEYAGRYGIKPLDIEKHQHELFTLISFYGLEAIPLAEQMAKTRNLIDDRINMKALEKSIQAVYQEHSRVKAHVTTKPVAALTKKNAEDLAKLGFTKSQIELIQRGTQVSPVEFLYAQRESGLVGSNEIFVLKKLVEQNIFSDTVLKIFIINAVKDRESGTLNAALVNTIANTWVKAKVDSPSKAIEQMQARITKQNNRQTTGRKATVRKEKMPDWAKPDYQPAQQTISAEEEKKLAEQIAKLKASQEGE